MSEYQYYEFRATDRALNDRQMRELRDLCACRDLAHVVQQSHIPEFAVAVDATDGVGAFHPIAPAAGLRPA